jgi:cytoskeletal protein RodZ
MRPPGRRGSFTRRRSVTVTLVVWVFALMTGIANACVLHARQPRHDGQGSTASAEASVDPDGHTSTCNDSWDSAAATVAKSASQESPSTYWGPAAVQSHAGCPKLASGAVTRQPVDDGVLAHGPPGAIQFLRLRL